MIFRTTTPFKEKSSDHFKDVHKLELLTNFDFNLISSPGCVMNNVFKLNQGFHEVSKTISMPFVLLIIEV